LLNTLKRIINRVIGKTRAFIEPAKISNFTGLPININIEREKQNESNNK